MKKLRELREENNLTYAEMAEELNISKAYYWQIENKTRGLSYRMAMKIANFFKLKPDEVFYEDVKTEAK